MLLVIDTERFPLTQRACPRESVGGTKGDLAE
ncbi:hypothetical protein Dform_01563 [Dehalogenimonas formicexedens]|uniref:Uncharacterized protein n=1 Tax=Dehalogenimonas formicexedens TaxID=1839801 RepID=A0A1P8F8T8_9CHLR|nr:hypothetical protein Dform_01563 [Dehalogenimonas formicexedens]